MNRGTDAPLVSVCIPALNAERTIQGTLDSLLCQDYRQLEIIVSDNGSSDRTASIVQGCADARVRLVPAPTRPTWAAGQPAYLGAYENANHVLSLARGDLLCLYHADDLYQPDIVRKQAAFMDAHPDVGVVFTGAQLIGDHGGPIRLPSPAFPRELDGRVVLAFAEVFDLILRHGNFLPTPSAMLRRAAVRDVGVFDERRFRTSADLELWLRIGRTWRIGLINERLLNYRISPKQFGAQYERSRNTTADLFLVVDHFLADPVVRAATPRGALQALDLWRAADEVTCSVNLLLQGDVPQASRRLREALRWRRFVTARTRPRRLANLLFGACLLAGANAGLGPILARAANAAYAWEGRRRRQPRRT